MNNRCLIVTGGEFSPFPGTLCETDFIIACDRGYEYAEKLGIKPHLILGDFDSSSFPETEIPVEKFPAEKDDTDTMLAVKEALRRGFREICLLCAFGGRMDHSFANIQSGAYAAFHNADMYLYGKDTEAVISGSGEIILTAKEGWSLSVFALSDIAGNVRIQGTKYETGGMLFRNSFPLGVSNEFREKTAKICFDSGILMAMLSKLPEEGKE